MSEEYRNNNECLCPKNRLQTIWGRIELSYTDQGGIMVKISGEGANDTNNTFENKVFQIPKGNAFDNDLQIVIKYIKSMINVKYYDNCKAQIIQIPIEEMLNKFTIPPELPEQL